MSKVNIKRSKSFHVSVMGLQWNLIDSMIVFFRKVTRRRFLGNVKTKKRK